MFLSSTNTLLGGHYVCYLVILYHFVEPFYAAGSAHSLHSSRNYVEGFITFPMANDGILVMLLTKKNLFNHVIKFAELSIANVKTSKSSS